jgi:hypothetical protein
VHAVKRKIKKEEMNLYECVLRICVFGMSFTIKDVYVVCVCVLRVCVFVMSFNMKDAYVCVCVLY